MAGGKAAVLDAGHPDSGTTHFSTKPFIFAVGRTDMAHIAAGTGQRDRLVGPLATKCALVVKRRQCLSRGREMWHRVDKVDIDGA